MLATIRDLQGQGDAALFVRARDPDGHYWNWVSDTWEDAESVATKAWLTEYDDADPVQSRYSAEVEPPAGEVVLEYVREATALVIGEESLSVPGTTTGTVVGAQDPGGRYPTAGEVIAQVALECDLNEVADPFTSNDRNSRLLRGLLTSCGRELVLLHPWQNLVRTCEFTTQQNDTGVYTLPADFNYMIDQTAWVRSKRAPLGGPLSPQQWEYAKGRSLGATISAWFRPAQGSLWLYPQPPEVGLEIAYEYITRCWVQSAGANTLDADHVSASLDKVYFDWLLIVAHLKLRFLQTTGFDTAMATADFQRIFDMVASRDSSAPEISLDGTSKEFRLIDGANLPETGWGT
jgi:hypothetical protein